MGAGHNDTLEKMPLPGSGKGGTCLGTFALNFQPLIVSLYHSIHSNDHLPGIYWAPGLGTSKQDTESPSSHPAGRGGQTGVPWIAISWDRSCGGASVGL